jgi:PAS domain S-box-containing protein
MSALFRPIDWPLRVKMAALLVIASLLPLGVATWIDIREARERLVVNTAELLAARGDHLADQIDAFHRVYQASVAKLARLPLILQFYRASPGEAERLKPALGGVFDAHLGTDPNVRGVVILDLAGTVKVATEEQLIGQNLAHYSYVREALQGRTVISDIYVAESPGADEPTIAYLAPVLGLDGNPVAVAVLWVRASALWAIMKQANELAGPGSFAVLFDRFGIRIGHTYSAGIVFHPGGRLASATLDALVAERRFGEKTRQLLEDVRAFPEPFARALATSPGREIFRGVAPVNQQWNYGVGRRLETVPWTIFYMLPERSLNPPIARMIRHKTMFAGAIMIFALLAGTLFAAVILGPIGSLSRATKSIAGGDLTARVQPGGSDELGLLGTSFNSMAGRIEAQATALQRARAELELRVQERTAELRQKSRDLELQTAERERLAAIAEYSDDAIISKDLSGVITSWNLAAERMFGYSGQEMLGKPMKAIIPPDRLDEERRILAQIIRGEVIDHFETMRVGKDGKSIAVSVTVSPIKDRDGKIIGASKIARDISARKLAEEAVRHSEAQYRTLFDTLIEGFCTIEVIFDADGKTVDFRFLETNPAFEKQTGLHNAQGKLMRDLAPNHEAHWFEIFGKIALTGEPAQFENEAKALGRHYDVCAYRVGGPESRKVAVLFNDITERKRAEAAVRESEDRFRTMANSMPQLAWIARADGYIFWYNQRWYEYTGTTPEQMEGWDWQSVHDPAVLPKVMENWTGAISSAQPFEMEFPLRGADGQFRTFLTRVQPLKDAAGRVVQWFGTNTDVEVLKRAEQAIRQSEEYFHFLNDLAEATRPLAGPAQIMAVTARMLGEHLHASRCAYADVEKDGEQFTILHDYTDGCASTVGSYKLSLFGARAVATLHSRQTLIIRSVAAELLPGEGADMFNAIGIQAIITCPLVKDGGLRAMMAVHQTTPRDWQPDEVSIVQEVVERCWATIERRTAEDKLHQLNTELEQRVIERTQQFEAANKELEAFSYSVSHDLRSPLRTMDGFSQALVEDYGPQLPEEGRRYLQTIREGAQRMGALIDDLLEFARLSQQALKKQTVDMDMLLRTVLEELDPSQQERQIEIRRAELPPCLGDPALLKQVWLNLISNALKYTRKCKPAIVEIGCARVNGANTYFVRDNGTGFDMQYAHKLFGVFQRLHRAEDYEGTGVGLAIVQRVVHRHGGRVWAEAAVDRGATFYFALEGETKT